MRYVMRQKILCIGDDFTVRDESGRDVYYVDGKVFTLRQSLAIQDMAGHELARIQKRILAIGPTWDVYRSGTLVATVSKDLFTLFRCSFTVDVPGPDDLQAQGGLLDHEYEFTRGGRTVATVSKSWFSITDTYGVDVVPGEDDVVILASAVVIDMACHEEHERKRK